MENQKIRVKAMCLLLHENKVLVAKGDDSVTGKKHYRVLGGSLDFFETSEEGVRREIREELNSEIENLELITAVENLFEYEGKKGHEVVFVYKGTLQRKELHDQKVIHIVEGGYEFDAEWVPVADLLSSDIPLYPSLDYTNILK